MKIFNSLSRQKETFVPIQEKKIKLYVCGMTVYDFCHLGHARVLVAFDVITRYLRKKGYDVTYIRNITDVDDKIIQRAEQNNESTAALTQRFIDAMHEDLNLLSILPPNREPRATEFMQQMIEMIKTLISKEYAYVADNGDVYFSVKKFPHYGCLSHKDIEGLQAGARVEINDVKKDALDFVLWKLAKPNEPSWDSPWGKGRPGWHIECSAMSVNCLGEHFDIHGGGFDLQFPHHENEQAHAESATGKKFVNTWMHVGFLQINKEKMSKSLGNFFTIRDVLKEYQPEVIRYFLISSHYRSPLNYSTENLENAKNAIARLYLTLRDLTPSQKPHAHPLEQRFYEVMDDDFNTPEALAVLFELLREINRVREQDSAKANELAALLKELAEILGVLQQTPEKYLHTEISQEENIEIEALIEQRQIARQNKQWQEADRIRDELTKRNIIVEDKDGKTIWRKV